MTQYFGKYRGEVTRADDPRGLGRVQVRCPEVLGDGTLSWAMPCVPFAGPGIGFFSIPPRGAHVWVEFEKGDPSHPIWTGCFWAPGQVPADPPSPEITVIKTRAITLELNDQAQSGGFKLEVGSPAVSTPMKIVCNSSGIELSIGGAKLVLSTKGLNVNNGALEVLP